MAPALFIASYAMPADIAPSPMTAMQRRLSPFSFEETAMPSAAEIEVLECAVPKSGDAVLHAQPRHFLAAAGEDLVRVGLVADVPDDAVLGRVVDVVQRE